MQSPLRSAGSPDGPGATLSLIAAVLVGIAILLSQTVFIVPAGNVAVVTTLGKVTGTPRSPGANIKAPLVQNTSLFDVRTQVRPEQFSTLTKDLQVIQATATVKYAMKPAEAGRIYETIATDDQQIYPRVIQPSLLKALKSVFSQYELVTIATEWNSISELVQEKVVERYLYLLFIGIKDTGVSGLFSVITPGCGPPDEGAGLGEGLGEGLGAGFGEGLGEGAGVEESAGKGESANKVSLFNKPSLNLLLAS